MGHVSAPHNSVDKTKASYNRIFVCVLRSLPLHIFVSLPKTPLALPNLARISLSQLLSCHVNIMSYAQTFGKFFLMPRYSVTLFLLCGRPNGPQNRIPGLARLPACLSVCLPHTGFNSKTKKLRRTKICLNEPQGESK